MKHKAKQCGFCLQLKPIEGFRKIGKRKRCRECAFTSQMLEKYEKELKEVYDKYGKPETLNLIKENEKRKRRVNTYRLKGFNYKMGI